MSFSEVLKETVERIPGAVAALIVASDGIPVEEYKIENLLDFNDLSAEASTFIKDVEIASEELRLGRAKEFSLISDRCGIIMHRITAEYYFCVVIKPDGNYGKARFVLKTVIPKIEKEF